MEIYGGTSEHNKIKIKVDNIYYYQLGWNRVSIFKLSSLTIVI